MVRKIHRLILLLLLHAPLCVEAKLMIHYSDSMTWQDAQTFCREHHDDLVTIEGELDNWEIFSFDGWIGLHREDNEWKWSATGTTATYFYWKFGERPEQACVYKMNEQLQWRTKDCTDKYGYTCSSETMIVVKEKKTWEEALQHCRSLKAIDTSRPATDYQNNRYDLVSLLTADDRNAAQKIALEASTDEVWTGLRFLAGRWMWVIGVYVPFHSLPECPTALYCGTLEKHGDKASKRKNCKERRNFICQFNRFK